MSCSLKGESELNLTSSNQTCPGSKFTKNYRRMSVSCGIFHHISGEIAQFFNMLCTACLFFRVKKVNY